MIILGAFFVLLPVMLMVDFWGDERLTARGRPVSRPWVSQRERTLALDDRGHEAPQQFPEQG